MGLYDLDGWRVVAFIVGVATLSLLLVEAMMQFTSALLERPATRRQRKFVPLDGMRSLLLELRGEGYTVEPRGASGLIVLWDVLGGAPIPPGTRVKLTTVWSTRMLLDPRRREARWFESVRRSHVFLGFYGRRPVLLLNWWYQGGYLSGDWSGRAFLVTTGFPPRIIDERSFDINTDLLRKSFVTRVTESGWTFRPVTLPLYTSSRWLTLTEHVVPDALARVPRRRLWVVLYPATYVLLLAFLLAPFDGLSWRDGAIVALVSAGWWGVWGGIAWLLARKPARRRLVRRLARGRRRDT